jgi:mono/diheme cytochrome c family protein
MRRPTHGGAGFGGLLALALLLPPVVRAAEEANPGKALYLRYCGACHGETGKGDGFVSNMMEPRPVDLTQLAKKAGGEFPFLETMKIIDGRETKRAHGDPDMPVWGEVFRPAAGTAGDQHAELAGKLLMITEYLRSIQQ